MAQVVKPLRRYAKNTPLTRETHAARQGLSSQSRSHSSRSRDTSTALQGEHQEAANRLAAAPHRSAARQADYLQGFPPPAFRRQVETRAFDQEEFQRAAPVASL